MWDVGCRIDPHPTSHIRHPTSEDAMATINSDFTVFEQGGTILLGADTVLNVPENGGDASWEPGLYEPIYKHDRGVLGVAPKQGSQRHTKLTLKVKFRASVTAGEVYKILTTAGSSGLMKVFSIVLKHPSAPQ